MTAANVEEAQRAQGPEVFAQTIDKVRSAWQRSGRLTASVAASEDKVRTVVEACACA